MSLEVKDFDKAYKRLLEATGIKNQNQLAEMLGISRAGVTHSVKQKKLPLEWILKAHYKLGVNVRYVLDGEHPKVLPIHSPDTLDNSLSTTGTIQAGKTTYVQIPMVSHYLDKKGNFQFEDDSGMPYLIIASKVADSLDGNRKDLVGMKVMSSDMEPDISLNDSVIINTAMTKPVPKGLFLFNSKGFLFIRHVSFERGEFLVYSSVSLNPESFEELGFTCFGRVVWHAHKLI